MWGLTKLRHGQSHLDATKSHEAVTSWLARKVLASRAVGSTRYWRIASLSWNLRSDLCSSPSVHLDRVPIPCPVTSQELRNDGDVDSDRNVRVAWLEQCHRSRRTRNPDHAHTPKRVTPRTNGPGHRKDRPHRPMLGAARDVTLTAECPNRRAITGQPPSTKGSTCIPEHLP
jgi:hypothetical protein